MTRLNAFAMTAGMLLLTAEPVAAQKINTSVEAAKKQALMSGRPILAIAGSKT